MKAEKEVLWLVNLLNSKFVKKNIGSSVGGCKSDLERVSGASENNAQFRSFLNELIEDGDLEFFERKKIIGKYVNLYIIDIKKIIMRLRKIPFYLNLKKLIINKETILGYGI